MPRIMNISYSKSTIVDIKEWLYGSNWPAVYIIYNSKKAYVGETLDLARRTEQHLQEEVFSEFNPSTSISIVVFPFSHL